MRKVLFLDRSYATLFVSSDKFESIYVCLGRENKKDLLRRRLKVVGCFDEEYSALPQAVIPDNYLMFSFAADRFLKLRFDYSKRREILGKEISFWSKVLDEQKPDLIVNEVCTTEFVEVLYIEAKKRGIDYKTFLYGFQDNYAYWLDSPFNSEICESRWESVTVTDEIRQKAEAFCDSVIDRQSQPYYVRNLNFGILHLALHGLNGLFRAYLNALRHRREFHYEDYRVIWKTWMNARLCRLVRRYDDLGDVKDEEYVFFPLHFVPEATISYFAEFFSEQAEVIEEMARCLKTNQRLVVKEHPQQVGMLLTRSYREVKRRNPNIVYLPGNIPSSDVIARCKLIVTITGTAGFEGIILGKPVITLGNVFYNHCSEVRKASSYKELKRLLREETYAVPDRERVRHFVAEFFAMQSAGMPSYNASQENIDNFTHHIEKMLANE